MPEARPREKAHKVSGTRHRVFWAGNSTWLLRAWSWREAEARAWPLSLWILHTTGREGGKQEHVPWDMHPGQEPSCLGLKMVPDREEEKGQGSKREEEIGYENKRNPSKSGFWFYCTMRDLIVFWVSSHDSSSRLVKPLTLWRKVSVHAWLVFYSSPYITT